eukprot:TRINITY_DN14411_c0_g1_i2.p1 TRINITY_DN14411_c0_g1~~TRINITY_DN14411_c0_g1_i2.p1  ORF type:complete len:166 (+),score=27.71 TRINITY_DN14411_c0_g1_i2:385-882(+)
MDRHRRRMELGSRLSVFQLKEAQLYVNEGVVLSDVEGSAAYTHPPVSVAVAEAPPISRLAPTGELSGRSLLQYFKPESEGLTNVVSRVDMLRRVSLQRQNSNRQMQRPSRGGEFLPSSSRMVMPNDDGPSGDMTPDDDTGDEIYKATANQASPYRSMHYDDCDEE